MNIQIAGRHMEVTDALKDHVSEGLAKVRSHFQRVIDADVVLDVEKHRHIAEITLHANGIRIHGKESSEDMYASVDAVINKLEKQVRRFKDRINRYEPRKIQEAKQYAHQVLEWHAEEAEEESGNGHRVIEHEQLSMKPMSLDEAAMQLELSGDLFLVFSNADTQQVNVIYNRNDGTFGVIEPAY